jgi:hypothetical protein
MGMLLNESIAPTAPASGKKEVWLDSSDKRVKYIGSDGVHTIPGDAELWNYCVNSGLWFAQRQVPATLTTYSIVGGRLYTADAWFVGNENASVQYQRVDTSGAKETGLTSRYYGRVKKTTSAGKMYVGQALLGDDACQLRGRTVRFQARLRCSVASAMNVRLGLMQLTTAGTLDTIPSTANLFFTAMGAVGTDPTPGANLAYIAPKAGVTAETGTVNGNAVDCALTTTWQRFGTCFDVPTTLKNLIVIVWTNGQPAALDELNFSEMSLTAGQEIQDWTPSNRDDEFWRVAPFYQKSFARDTAPVQNGGLGGSKRAHIANAGAVATSWSGAEVRFPAQFFKTPTTVTLYNPSAANAFVRNVTLSTDATATSAANTSEAGMHVNCTGLAAWVAGNDSAVHWSAEAFL